MYTISARTFSQARSTRRIPTFHGTLFSRKQLNATSVVTLVQQKKKQKKTDGGN